MSGINSTVRTCKLLLQPRPPAIFPSTRPPRIPYSKKKMFCATARCRNLHMLHWLSSEATKEAEEWLLGTKTQLNCYRMPLDDFKRIVAYLKTDYFDLA